MKPIWIVGSNVDTSSPLTTSSEKLKQEAEDRKQRNTDRDLNKKNSNVFGTISTNIRGLVRGFTSLFKGGTGLNGSSSATPSSSDSSSSTLSTNLSNDALMRVFSDTWEYEMGKQGPGVIGKPLNDGAGKNYGAASFTQKYNMESFRAWLKQRYPNLESKLVGATCSTAFDASWEQLGKTDEQAFLKAQIEYTFESKLIPWINKLKQATGVDLNNGKYSEGVFSLLLSMSNQRPAWINEKVIPFFKSNPNATSEQIINGLGGWLANNYSGNYASSIRNRYKKQVAHSLTMTNPFSLSGSGSSSNNNGSSLVYNDNTSAGSTSENTTTSTTSGSYGSGTFDSTYAVSDEEKAEKKANDYWKNLKDSGGHAYNSVHNNTKQGKNKAKHTSGNTSGWKSSYNKDSTSLINFKNNSKNTLSSKMDTDGKNPYQNIIDRNEGDSSINYGKPSNTVTANPDISVIKPSNGSGYKPPSSLVEIKDPIKNPSNSNNGNNSSNNGNNSNNNNSSTVTPENPTYFFDKEKFEKILNSLTLISDYTGEIETTNKLLEKMKKVIKKHQEECKKKTSSKNSSNSSKSNDFYDSLFKNNNTIENQFYFGF